MKPDEIGSLKLALQHPIPYHRVLASVGGGATAVLFLKPVLVLDHKDNGPEYVVVQDPGGMGERDRVDTSGTGDSEAEAKGARPSRRKKVRCARQVILSAESQDPRATN